MVGSGLGGAAAGGDCTSGWTRPESNRLGLGGGCWEAESPEDDGMVVLG
jgi:hypothetical protein